MTQAGLGDAPLPSFVLTQEDVDRLLSDPSPESRMSVLDHVSKHYNRHSFGEREREVAEQIFRLLMKDVVLAVRETLAIKIQDNSEIPRDVILQLANDSDTVSMPILMHSTVLSDADLIQIIESNADLTKLLAITKRSHLSSHVSEALVETNHADIIGSLVKNQGAQIKEDLFEKIIHDFRNDKHVIDALAHRDRMPMTVVERLVHVASHTMAEHIKSKYRLTDHQMQSGAAAAQEDVLLYMLSNDVAEAELVAMVEQMSSQARLTPTLIAKGLCRGQLNFFIAALARLAGIPYQNAQRLISDKGDLGYDGIYAKTKLPDSMRPAIRLVLRGVQSLEHDDAIPGSRLYANRLADYILQQVGQENILHLPHFLALIRQPIKPH